MAFLSCPRCAEAGYQVFATHAYCVGCNYSPDFDLGTISPNRRTPLKRFRQNGAPDVARYVKPYGLM
jgi:hypothetical protein